MGKVLFAVLAVVLTPVSVVLAVAKLRLQGIEVGSAHGAGMLLGSTIAVPLVSLAIASCWRANRTPGRLLIAANIGLALSVLGSLGQLGKAARALPPSAAASGKSQPRSGWLRDCADTCVASTHKAQPQLSGELALQFCEANCGCMIEQVTAPAATSGEVMFPSPTFKAMPKPRQLEVVAECTRAATLVLKRPAAP